MFNMYNKEIDVGGWDIWHFVLRYLQNLGKIIKIEDLVRYLISPLVGIPNYHLIVLKRK